MAPAEEIVYHKQLRLDTLTNWKKTWELNILSSESGKVLSPCYSPMRIAHRLIRNGLQANGHPVIKIPARRVRRDTRHILSQYRLLLSGV